jgi:hypothetical protein
LNKLGISSVNFLNTNTWTSAELQDVWFDGQFEAFQTSPYTVYSPLAIQSVNTHFEHFQAYPPEAWEDETKPTFLAQSILTPTSSMQSPGLSRHYFTNRICYSVGCHSGLNVEGAQTNETGNTRTSLKPGVDALYLADFAQAYNKQGGNLIGNTGYGYGDYDLIAYTERLSALYSAELGRNVTNDNGQYIGQTAGMGLVDAKQRYIENATSIDVYDVKSLMQATFYGLPFLRVKVPNPTAIPIEDLGPDKTPEPGLTIERIITFTLTIDDQDRRQALGNGREYPALQAGDIQVEDSFVQEGFRPAEPRLIEATNEGLPVLPKFAYDITALEQDGNDHMVVKDVMFQGGLKYPPLQDYKPQITEIVTQGQPLLTPSFEDGLNVWYPGIVYDHTSTGEGAEQRDQLVITPAQYKALEEDEETGTEGTMWLYEQMTFKVLYADQSVQDVTPPIINRVRVVEGQAIGLQQATQRIVVEVTDPDSDTGLPEDAVQVTFSNNTRDWWSRDLRRVVRDEDGVELWVTEIEEGTTSPSYVVMARDQAGNVAYFNGKDALSAPSAEPVRGSVSFDAPARTLVNTTVNLTATVSMAREDANVVTLPISYTWQLDPGGETQRNRVLSLNTENLTTDTLTVELPRQFNPTESGYYTFTLSIGNIAESKSISGTHTLEVLANNGRLPFFLPLIQR